VVSAAVIVRDPSAPFLSRVNDSKKLSERAREKAFEEIQARCVVSVSMRDAARIDEINIYQATLETMREAVERLEERPNLVLIDGPIKLAARVPIRGIIGGDALSFSIACASIAAKVTRDRIMVDFDAQYPEYGFKQHKGYGTAQHMAALKEHGPCPIHRRSFAPVAAVS
jgi:ribonuclease HII